MLAALVRRAGDRDQRGRAAGDRRGRERGPPGPFHAERAGRPDGPASDPTDPGAPPPRESGRVPAGRPRRGGGRHHQHRGGVGNADHVPDPPRVRRAPGDRQRLATPSVWCPAACPASSATAASSSASAPACCGWARRRCSAGSSGRCCSCGCPSSAFDAIVPVLIALGVVLVLLGPRISRVGGRTRRRAAAASPDHGVWWVWPAVALAGVYGGYFGAAQGVLLMAVLGIGVADSMQRLNATKNVLALARQRGRRAGLHRGRRRRLGRRRPDRRRVGRRRADRCHRRSTATAAAAAGRDRRRRRHRARRAAGLRPATHASSQRSELGVDLAPHLRARQHHVVDGALDGDRGDVASHRGGPAPDLLHVEHDVARAHVVVARSGDARARRGEHQHGRRHVEPGVQRGRARGAPRAATRRRPGATRAASSPGRSPTRRRGPGGGSARRPR